MYPTRHFRRRLSVSRTSGGNPMFPSYVDASRCIYTNSFMFMITKCSQLRYVSLDHRCKLQLDELAPGGKDHVTFDHRQRVEANVSIARIRLTMRIGAPPKAAM